MKHKNTLETKAGMVGRLDYMTTYQGKLYQKSAIIYLPADYQVN